MSKTASPLAVGIFVLGAGVLVVAGLIFFGSYKFFSQSLDVVCYFDEPVSGLDVGSPVKFRGVPVGTVKKIYIRFNQGDETDHIPVIIELDVTLLNSSLGVDIRIQDEETFAAIVNAGYRAQLVTTSFITGLRDIEIDIHEDAGFPRFFQVEKIYKELPTISSLTAALGQSLDEMLAQLANVDVQAINDNLIGVLKRAREGLDEMNFRRLNDSIAEAAEFARDLLQSPKVQEAMDNINSTLIEYEGLTQDIRGKIDPVLAKAKETNEQLQSTLQSVREVSAKVDLMLAPESTFRYQLDRSLLELEETLEAVRLLVESLERSPRSLLTGKALPEEEGNRTGKMKKNKKKEKE